MIKWKSQFGIIAQLVEHMPYKHGVIGSSPIGSTKKGPRQRLWTFFFFKMKMLLNLHVGFVYFLRSDEAASSATRVQSG